MKTYKLLIFSLIFTLFACEEKVDLPLNTDAPRLVIDASIDWFKGTIGNEQNIKLTQTTSFYDNTIVPANGAQVVIFDNFGNTFPFIEVGTTGNYTTTSFVPEIDKEYNLEIIFEDQTYTATETLKSVVSIDRIEQIDDTGFTGEETEIKAYFTDPIDEENYYLFSVENDIESIPTLDAYKDEFVNGNEIFGYYSNEEISEGNILNIKIYGISSRYYEYMFLLLQQSVENDGSPFQTQPATVRGNFINITNPDNFPYGYFRLSEVDSVNYIVE